MTHVNAADVKVVVQAIATVAIENEKRFGELDAVVGDGDFGYSLAHGFEQVIAEIDSIDDATVGAFLGQVGLLVTKNVGGTSGPLWGTAFLRAASVAGDRTVLSPVDVVAMLRAAIEGIQHRGHAELGDKTMLDALIPAVDKLEYVFTQGGGTSAALHSAAETAWEHAESTRAMVARRGRAAYAGERSLGTLDAGAVAVAEMFLQVNQAWHSALDLRSS